MLIDNPLFRPNLYLYRRQWIEECYWLEQFTEGKIDVGNAFLWGYTLDGEDYWKHLSQRYFYEIPLDKQKNVLITILNLKKALDPDQSKAENFL